MASLATRGLIVAAAVVAGAWLVFSIHAVDLQAKGERTLAEAQRGKVSGERVDRALAQLRDADRLNPDLTPLLDQGFLLIAAGRPAAALSPALKAVAVEPENAQGWVLGYLATANGALAERAREKVKELNYWLAQTLPKPPPQVR